MAYHITENSTMDEVKSMTVDKRSATKVMPTGASQPPTCKVWMPSKSATANSVRLTKAENDSMKNATWDCTWRKRANSSVNAAPATGFKSGSGMRQLIYGITSCPYEAMRSLILDSLDCLFEVSWTRGIASLGGTTSGLC